MAVGKLDLAVYGSLSIVTIDGFKPTEDLIDPPGSANWLVESYGLHGEDQDADEPGILWTDYDCSGWQFRVLIDSEEVDDLKRSTVEAGYTIEGVEEVSEPIHFGDGAGVVAILKHPDGWVVLA